LEWFEEVPETFLTSAETHLGCPEILGAINDINKNFQS